MQADGAAALADECAAVWAGARQQSGAVRSSSAEDATAGGEVAQGDAMEAVDASEVAEGGAAAEGAEAVSPPSAARKRKKKKRTRERDPASPPGDRPTPDAAAPTAEAHDAPSPPLCPACGHERGVTVGGDRSHAAGGAGGAAGGAGADAVCRFNVGGAGADAVCRFNVGGERFMCAYSTLCRLGPDNFLTALVQRARAADGGGHGAAGGGGHGALGVLRDERGFLFIDHSPRVFEAVLDYLRTGVLAPPPWVARRLVLAALDFFQIPPPRRLVPERGGAEAQRRQYAALDLSSIEAPLQHADSAALLLEWQRRAGVFFREHLELLSAHVHRSIAEGRDPISVVSFHTAGHQVQGVPLHELRMSGTGSIGPLLWSKRPTTVFLRYLRALIEEQWSLPAHIKVLNPGQLGESAEIRMHCTRERAGDDVQVIRDILEVCFDEHRSTLRVRDPAASSH